MVVLRQLEERSGRLRILVVATPGEAERDQVSVPHLPYSARRAREQVPRELAGWYSIPMLFHICFSQFVAYNLPSASIINSFISLPDIPRTPRCYCLLVPISSSSYAFNTTFLHFETQPHTMLGYTQCLATAQGCIGDNQGISTLIIQRSSRYSSTSVAAT